MNILSVVDNKDNTILVNDLSKKYIFYLFYYKWIISFVLR